MGRPTSTGPRRGRPSKFSPEDAVEAALDIGVSTFTMAAVAEKLGITSPALYRCFSSRDDLLEACLRKISSRVTDPPHCEDWREFLGTVADSAWDMFTRYPYLEAVFTSQTRSLRAVFPVTDQFLTQLNEFGFTWRQSVFSLMYITDLTTSAVAHLQRQLAEFLRDRDSPGARVFRGPDDEPLTDRESLTEASRRQWRSTVDFFLDHLAVVAPRWPEYTGPVARPPQPQ